MSLLELFVEVYDFCQIFEEQVAKQQLRGKAKPGPSCGISRSEIMTLVIDFHQEGYRNWVQLMPRGKGKQQDV